MIQPLFSYAHYCKCGHLNTNNHSKMDKCEALVHINEEEYLKDPKSCIYDDSKKIYLKRCGIAIDKAYTLPRTLEFTQVYSREIFDGIMKGHELSQFFFETHKNIAQIHLALDEIANKLNIHLRNAGKQRRK